MEGIRIRKGVFAILDPEMEFAENLMNYGNFKGSIPFQFSVYSGINPLLEYVEDSEINLLLLGEEYIEIVDQLETVISNIYILWEGRAPRESYHLSCIYKYQSAGNIIRETYEQYLEQCSNGDEYLKIIPSHNNHIIGVFSPYGNNKKTLYALMLSEYYGINQSTLYVNLDLFNQLSWLETDQGGGLSEILYYVKQRKSNLSLKIESLAKIYGHFHIIAPVIHFQDLYEITEEDIDFLLGCLREYCEYRFIIIDIGVFGKSIKKVFDNCDRIYIPIEQSNIEVDKLLAFNKQMRKSSTEEFMKKFQEIEFPSEYSFVGESRVEDVIHNDVLYDYVASIVESGEAVG